MAHLTANWRVLTDTYSPPDLDRPDGALPAFNWYSESSLGHSGNVYTVRPDGTEPTELTATMPAARRRVRPSWTQDGRQIGFAQASDVFTMTPIGTDITQVTNRPQHTGGSHLHGEIGNSG
jgi:Tol biopolymer transport system component